MKREGRKASLHCAIYTRVSTENGLEQEFNSLDNQREASEAYIRSLAIAGSNCWNGQSDGAAATVSTTCSRTPSMWDGFATRGRPTSAYPQQLSTKRLGACPTPARGPNPTKAGLQPQCRILFAGQSDRPKPCGEGRTALALLCLAGFAQRPQVRRGIGHAHPTIRPMRVQARAVVAESFRNAHRWLDELVLDRGQTIESMAARERKSERSIRMTLPLSSSSADCRRCCGRPSAPRVQGQATDGSADRIVPTMGRAIGRVGVWRDGVRLSMSVRSSPNIFHPNTKRRM